MNKVNDNCDEELLAKMEEINRSLQLDSKSVHTLSNLSRNNSITSDLNLNSITDEDKISLNSVSGLSPNMNSDCSEKWCDIIKNYSQYSKRKNSIKDLIRISEGIPHHFRPLVWQLLTGSSDDNANAVEIKSNYPEYLKMESPCEKAIRRDIARTYPQHELFKHPEGDGQERLFKIMKAYSIHDREVGYCQGSGFIGGLLLIHMPEEEAFTVLVQLMCEYQLRNLYKPSMSQLGLYMHQLDYLVSEHLAKLSQHFQSHNFTATVYASGWFLTLFTLTFTMDLACRVMDLFMIEGIEIIFKISLAYLTVFQDDLLKMDMESMLRFLQSIAPVNLSNDPNKLFDIALKIKLNAKKMKKAEKDYMILKMEEEENQIELRRLRTENGLLLQRIDRLEKETEQLTQNLVEMKRKFAEQAEQMSRSRSELIESKRQIDHLRRNLNGAENQLELAVSQLNGRITDEKSKQTQRGEGLGFDLVHQLQTELVNIRLKEAETNACYRELKEKYRLLEENNQQLSKHPNEEVARLQEDLVALKLREAETGLSLKESHKRLSDLTKLYKVHIESCPGNAVLCSSSRKPRHSVYETSNSNNNSTSSSVHPSHNNNNSSGSQDSGTSGLLLLARRVVETEYASELQLARQRLMHYESQQEITNRQLSRRDEHVIRIKESLDKQLQYHKELRLELQEADRRCVDLETKRKEDLMMWNIQRMELESQIAELKHQSAASSDIGLSAVSSVTPSNQQPAAAKWKNLPDNIMTESIGPLDELCFTPDDPMITSIYIGRESSTPTIQHKPSTAAFHSKSHSNSGSECD